MNENISRRNFLAGLGTVAAAARTARGDRMSSPFRLSIISDEITQDFGHACEVASREFGMHWIELRELWGKNLFNLDGGQLAEAKSILAKNKLRVCDIASPLFKVDWPGAPRSKFSPPHDEFNASFSFDQQNDVLARSIELAESFGAGRVRCFDFWRLDEPAPYRKDMNARLQEAAETLGKRGLVLVLENEMTCNTATGAEAGRVLAEVPSPHLMINWDPGNAAMHGENPYPDGYSHLPKNRIGHCHCKDVQKQSSGEGLDWAAMGAGTIDWVGQFRALKSDGYRLAVSLETHWRGAGTPEESSRQSWKGMQDELRRAGILA